MTVDVLAAEAAAVAAVAAGLLLGEDAAGVVVLMVDLSVSMASVRLERLGLAKRFSVLSPEPLSIRSSIKMYGRGSAALSPFVLANSRLILFLSALVCD